MALSKNQKLYIAGFAVIIVMCVATLALVNGDFAGSDDGGGTAAEDYGYTPWTDDLFTLLDFEMPGETESLLFAVQAAIGAFIIGYFIGLNAGKKKGAASAETAAEKCECDECECGEHGEDCTCGKCVEKEAAAEAAEAPAAEEPVEKKTDSEEPSEE